MKHTSNNQLLLFDLENQFEESFAVCVPILF